MARGRGRKRGRGRGRSNRVAPANEAKQHNDDITEPSRDSSDRSVRRKVVSRTSVDCLSDSSTDRGKMTETISGSRASLRLARRCTEMGNLNANLQAETENKRIPGMILDTNAPASRLPSRIQELENQSSPLSNFREQIENTLQLVLYQAPIDTSLSSFTYPSLLAKTNPSTSKPVQSGENISNSMLEEAVSVATSKSEAFSNGQHCSSDELVHHHGSKNYIVPPHSIPVNQIIDNKQLPVGESLEGSDMSISLNLSEMANMWSDDASDGTAVKFLGTYLVMVEGYQVKEASAPILREIIAKHGDIAMNCICKRAESRSYLLEMVCGIIRTLQEKDFKEITEEDIKTLLNVADDLKGVNLRVDWLYNRLDEIFKAKQMVKQCLTLKEANDNYIRVIKEIKGELEGYNAEIQALQERKKSSEEKLAIAEAEINRIKKCALEFKPFLMRFYQSSMVTDLL